MHEYVTFVNLQDNRYKCNISNLGSGSYVLLVVGGNLDNKIHRLVMFARHGATRVSISGTRYNSEQIEDNAGFEGNTLYIWGYADGWGSGGYVYRIDHFPST